MPGATFIPYGGSTTTRSFQSSLPVRGATLFSSDRFENSMISILAPCAGSNIFRNVSYSISQVFQSSLPVRGATLYLYILHTSYVFPNFNPRSPCRERLCGVECFRANLLFQSTLPARGATPFCVPLLMVSLFQSTLPTHTGSDFGGGMHLAVDFYFNPLSPHGERRDSGPH